MIVNISERTQADNEFLVQSILTALMKSRKQFRSRVIGLIISVMLLAAAAAFVWLIVTAPRYHKKADFSIYAWLVVCTVLGVYGLVTWLFAKQITYRSTIRSKEWKSVIGMPVKTVFDGDTVTTFRSADGADTQTTYALNLIESFTDRGNTLYLCVTADNQKKYIILHDDGYTEGTKADVLALLQSRGVPQENPN